MASCSFVYITVGFGIFFSLLLLIPSLIALRKRSLFLDTVAIAHSLFAAFWWLVLAVTITQRGKQVGRWRCVHFAVSVSFYANILCVFMVSTAARDLTAGGQGGPRLSSSPMAQQSTLSSSSSTRREAASVGTGSGWCQHGQGPSSCPRRTRSSQERCGAPNGAAPGLQAATASWQNGSAQQQAER